MKIKIKRKKVHNPVMPRENNDIYQTSSSSCIRDVKDDTHKKFIYMLILNESEQYRYPEE